MTNSISTPIAFIIFNRPDNTIRVFSEIAKAKPSKLLIIADGPRYSHPDEAEKCAAARAIVEQVDWDCEVLTNYSDINLGCRKRISSGLNWLFSLVEEAIILEDDCVPDPSFFHFCENLLERYRFDERIMFVSGNNFQFGQKRTKNSYYFSQYTRSNLPVWGWASWRRAWQHYDVDMKLWNLVKEENWLIDITGDHRAAKEWRKILQAVDDKIIDTWDYQWLFSCWLQNGLVILPNVNLVSNIGYGSNATHTLYVDEYANIPIQTMSFPIQHPLFVVGDKQADKFTKVQTGKITTRVKNKLIKILN